MKEKLTKEKNLWLLAQEEEFKMSNLKDSIRSIRKAMENNPDTKHSISFKNWTWPNGDFEYMISISQYDSGSPIISSTQLITVRAKKENGKYILVDDAKDWLKSYAFDSTNTEEEAMKKIYGRARKISEIIARSCGIPLTEETDKRNLTRLVID